MIKEITKDNIKDIIATGVVMIKFGAKWCGPCRQIAPIIEKISTDFDKKVIVGDINIDNEPELANEMGIRSVPTIIFYKDGEEVNRINGMTAADALTTQINTLIG